MTDLTRRRLLQGALSLLALGVRPALAKTEVEGLITKAIPSSGQQIPVIGMGTWVTFNVGHDPETIASRSQVLKTFLDLGGGIVDSSPMYGSAEATVGLCREQIGDTPGLFSATKVWTSGREEGLGQIADSKRLWKLDRFDLFQVHNLLDWAVHLPVLLDMKAKGELGYVGITTSHGRRHSDLAELMQTQPLDFVQLTYNILDREVEDRLLPIAQDQGIAIIANRPFRRGGLIDRFEGKPLPAWAKDIGCHNWPQFLLKFIVSHPAVTCAIPATSRVDHMHENMAAGRGELVDRKTRQRMIDYVRSL